MSALRPDWRNDVSRAEAAVYDRIAMVPADQLAAAVHALPDAELLALQRCTVAAGDTDLRHLVGRAVMRRPHRGNWPTDLQLAGEGVDQR